MAPAPHHTVNNLTLTQQPSTSPEGNPLASQQPSLQDLRTIAADIKDTLSTAITDLRHEIQSIASRAQNMKYAAAHHRTEIRKIPHTVSTHTQQLRDLQRHVEDLDNGGRWHKLRVRGLPETVEPEQILPTVTGLFNHLLDKSLQMPINMERIHRAFRPQGRDTDPPRDIVCCLTDFRLKEEILRKVRNKMQLPHEGHEVHIYQDL